jgi:hypothetical protein
MPRRLLALPHSYFYPLQKEPVNPQNQKRNLQVQPKKTKSRPKPEK